MAALIEEEESDVETSKKIECKKFPENKTDSNLNKNDRRL